MIKVTGTITKIHPTLIQKDFKKRIFWLKEIKDQFPCDFSFETWKEDVNMLDSYKEGDLITAYIDLKGRKFVGKDGEEKVTNTLKVWNIEKDGVTYKKI